MTTEKFHLHQKCWMGQWDEYQGVFDVPAVHYPVPWSCHGAALCTHRRDEHLECKMCGRTIRKGSRYFRIAVDKPWQ